MNSAGQVEAVEPRCRGTKEIAFLGLSGAFRQKLAGIPEHRIAVGAFVDGEVALEHASRRGEGIDAGLDIGAPGVGQRLG